MNRKTRCIFNYEGQECPSTGADTQNITYMCCRDHLSLLYGVELEFFTFETPTSFEVVGGYLRPEKGTFFPKDTVIFPARDFFDKTHNGLPKTADDLKYMMNPKFEEFYNSISKQKNTLACKRYMIEMVRNLSVPVDQINTGISVDAALNASAKAVMKSNRTSSESMLQGEEYWKYIDQLKLLKVTEVSSIDMNEISPTMKYLLSKCVFGQQVNKQFDPIMHNAVYVQNVGLVAMEDISYPSTIVIWGIDICSPFYLDEVVNTITKKYTGKRVTLSDIPEPFRKRRILHGSGFKECSFG